MAKLIRSQTRASSLVKIRRRSDLTATNQFQKSNPTSNTAPINKQMKLLWSQFTSLKSNSITRQLKIKLVLKTEDKTRKKSRERKTKLKLQLNNLVLSRSFKSHRYPKFQTKRLHSQKAKLLPPTNNCLLSKTSVNIIKITSSITIIFKMMLWGEKTKKKFHLSSCVKVPHKINMRHFSRTI